MVHKDNVDYLYTSGFAPPFANYIIILSFYVTNFFSRFVIALCSFYNTLFYSNHKYQTKNNVT
jgi:hypothetical protein